MYSTNNEGKFVQLKYIVHLIYHSTIKMKHVNVKSSTYVDSSKEINDKDPKSKIWDTVNILKSKNILAKGSTPNWSKQIFVIKKVRNTAPWKFVSNDINGNEIVGTLKKKCSKQIKKNLELKQ